MKGRAKGARFLIKLIWSLNVELDIGSEKMSLLTSVTFFKKMTSTQS